MLKHLVPELESLISSTPGVYGVAVYHFESGESFFHRPDEPFYAASIIKIPIMAAAFDQASRGRLSLSERIVVRGEDMATGSGVLQHLTGGIELPVYDLIVLMIIESDNTATNLLIDRIGANAIQEAMREWGFVHSQFHHKLQIAPAARKGGVNTVTAREMTELMKRIARGNIVSRQACAAMIDIMKRQKYNDGLPGMLPSFDGPIGSIPRWQMAHKTGFVQGIEHDVGLLYVPGSAFAVSVLGKEVQDRLEAKRLMAKIGHALYRQAIDPIQGAAQDRNE